MTDTNNPLVSIGIPTYNRPKGLEKTIKCFINQTYSNLEIIISDNCSENPEVKKIAEKYSNSDNRISYIRQNINIGMFANFSFVLSNASGKYFMWASDDDSFENNFIMECWKIHDFHENLSLVSPICRVFTNDKIETMLYKPDFHTVGLNQLERMKKILFYIKKSHGAMTGLYKTRDIKKIKLKTILDADGLLLYELSSVGEFYQLKFPLVKSNLDYVENETKTSLTYEKEKFVKTYKIRPYFMWLKHEKMTLFLVFAIQSIKTNTITTTNKLRIIPTLFRSFFGKNRFKLLSMIKTICFYFRRTKIGFIFCIDKNKSLADLKPLMNLKIDIFIVQNMGSIGNYECLEIDYINQDLLYINGFYQLKGNWSTLKDQKQFALDKIRDKKFKLSHLVFSNFSKDFSIEKIEKDIIQKSKQFKWFNRAYRIDDHLIFPNRNYIDFKGDNELTVKEFN